MNLNNVPFVKYSHLTAISYLLCSSGSLHDAALLLWPQRTSYFRTVVLLFPFFSFFARAKVLINNYIGCSPFTKSFRKIRLESKWNTPFWVVPAEHLKR